MLKYEYFEKPFPHIYLKEIIHPDIYKTLKFPELKKTENLRTGRDLYKGDNGFDNIVGKDPWKEVYEAYNNSEVIKYILSVFKKDIRRYKNILDLDAIHYEDFIETVQQVETKTIDTHSNPNHVFTRFDFQAAKQTYNKGVHVDHARRIIGGVLFFSDYREEKMKGGKFGLYKDRLFGNDRKCGSPELIKEYEVVHNTGVLFLNCNEGFHGPTNIISIEGMRKWVYFSISSKRNIWERSSTSFQIRVLRTIKRKLTRLLSR